MKNHFKTGLNWVSPDQTRGGNSKDHWGEENGNHWDHQYGENQDHILEDDVDEVLAPNPWKGTSEVYQAIEKSRVASYTNRHQSPTPSTKRSVIFSQGRRESLLHAWGHPPLFYPRTLTQIKPKQEQVHLYVDVSGSMLSDSVLCFIFGLIIHLKENLGSHLYQFTTTVRAVTLDQIRQGKLLTGGTEINAVIQHALNHQFQRILVVTDGCFDSVDPDLLQQARKHGFYAGFLLTETQYNPSWFEEDLFEIWNLDDALRSLSRASVQASSQGRSGRGWGGGWGSTQNPKKTKKRSSSSHHQDGAISLPMPTPIQIQWGCAAKPRKA